MRFVYHIFTIFRIILVIVAIVKIISIIFSQGPQLPWVWVGEPDYIIIGLYVVLC